MIAENNRTTPSSPRHVMSAQPQAVVLLAGLYVGASPTTHHPSPTAHHHPPLTTTHYSPRIPLFQGIPPAPPITVFYPYL